MERLSFKLSHLFLPFSLVLLFLGYWSYKHSPSKIGSESLHLYLQAEPLSLDPRTGGDKRSQLVLRHLFEGLSRIGRDGAIELGLADSYSISPDGCVYTFHLRDAYWSNGAKITASDFCYAWTSALDPSFHSLYAYNFFIIKNAKKAKMEECPLNEVGVTALDEKTLQVTLEHPFPSFLELTASSLYAPLNSSIVQRNPEWPKSLFPKYVSNGPFILREHVLNSHILLERNPTYWNTKNRSASFQLLFSIIEHPATAYSLFEQGEIDWFGDPCGLCDLEVVEKMTREKTLISKPVGTVYWAVCNTQKMHLSSSKIRLAIASSINRKDLCSNLLKGGELPAKSIISHTLSLIDTPYFSDGDNEYAKQLFEEGLEELHLTKETYPSLEITHWAEPLSKLMAQCIQQQIKTTLGIPVTLVACDWSTYTKRNACGDFDLLTATRQPWIADPIFTLSYLKYPNDGVNGTHWSHPEYAILLDKADSALTVEERNRYLQQAERLTAQELPLIPIFELAFKYTKGPSVGNVAISRAGMFDFTHTKKWGQAKTFRTFDQDDFSP